MTPADDEITYSRLSLVDIGQVFWWKGRLFRGFPPSATSQIRKLFDCGLVNRLIEERLLVNSWLCTERFEGYELVVEHEVIPIPLYPREWTFTMLKDAAQLVLQVNELARRFGYQTKDCNGYNVLFREGVPVFVDFASFIEVAPAEDTLLSYEEFLLSYCYPLFLWGSAGQNLGNRTVPRAAGQLLAPEVYARYRWPLLRRVPERLLIGGFKILTSLRVLGHNDLQKLRKRHSALLIRLVEFVKARGLFAGPARIHRLRARVGRLVNRTGTASLWAGYHDSFGQGGKLGSTPRFAAVVGRLRDLGVGSVLELAGNQGVLSRLLKQALPALRVLCTDADGAAIDKGYIAARDQSAGIEWAIFNPFAAESSPVEIPAEVRFEADAVIALAVTHHLTLTQGFRLSYVFDVIARLTRRYVLIEFMPLGMHDGTRGLEPPAWYHEDWFRSEFERSFTLLERVQLEPNRVLFVGEIAPRAPGG